MKILVIDFETLGLGSNAYPLELGWVIMDINTPTNDRIIDKGHFAIAEEYSKQFCDAPEVDVIKWWAGESHVSVDAYEYFTSILDKSAIASEASTTHALRSLLCNCVGEEVESIWCTDKNFDYAIFANLLKNLNIYNPFKYNQVFETRLLSTVICPEIFEEIKTHSRLKKHQAMDDALYLAMCISAASDYIFHSASESASEHEVL